MWFDTVREMDNTIGTVLDALKASGVFENTLVFATSDNGPQLSQCEWSGHVGPWVGSYEQTMHPGGSAGKGTTWEGGHRTFGIVTWPGKIQPGVVSHALTSTLDIFPTIASVIGAELPNDRHYDGVDLSPILFNGAEKVRDFLFLVDCVSASPNLTALRYNNFSVYWQTNAHDGCATHFENTITVHDPPLVFDLTTDPEQSTPITLSPDEMRIVQSALDDKWKDIFNSFRTSVSFDGGGAPYWACCNPTHPDCRC
eukprot:c8205_g1_i2.p1 GENE.c8205_g1_i2~~c8205_g1_i2.p1  ORF type:complete len:255 (-),score=65.27 c8205_g1_i2:10-774(-)